MLQIMRLRLKSEHHLLFAVATPDPAFPPDGINLLPVCTGKKKTVDRTFYWRLFQSTKQKAIREGN